MNFNPTESSERIHSLDLLRGIAVLGILIMNIQSFSMPSSAYINPMAFGDMTGANKWVWILSHLFADQKFMTIFSILFGAGILLMDQRAQAKGISAASLHYRRNFWLLVIGLVHAYLIWYGDILVPYALCAFLVFLFRKLSAQTLMIWGLVFVALHTLIYSFFGYSLQFWPEEAKANIIGFWNPTEAANQADIDSMTGPLVEQLRKNAAGAIALETWVFFMQTFWRVTGNMLIGMALFKMGVLSAEKSKAYYQKGAIIGLVIGFAIISFGLMKNFEAGFAYDYSLYLGSQFNYWGSLFVAFGYICLVMLLARSKGLKSFKLRMQAVGQMAFTNYLSQSIICVLIFFGIGFGLYGQVDRVYQILIVPAIWLVQILWSQPWLKSFRFGPMEWLWRSLTYWKAQPNKV